MSAAAPKPCTCGHAESRHARLTLLCRVRTCRCQEFLNRERVEFLRVHADCAKREYEAARDRWLLHLDAQAGGELDAKERGEPDAKKK